MPQSCVVEQSSATVDQPTKTMEEGSPTNQTENPTECIVCWDTIQSALDLTCGHVACRPCIESWIERCEQDGQENATCPHCRQTLDTTALLGRPFCSAPKQSASAVDDFTRLWLQTNNARACTNCGTWMIAEEDADDGACTACVCGYIYCWHCQRGETECSCDHVEFYDQLTDSLVELEAAHRFPVAGPEHFADSLANFMEERRAAIYRYQDGDFSDEEDHDEEVEEEEIHEEPAEADFTPIFWDCKMEVQEAH